MNARQRSGDSRKWWISVTALLVQVSLGIVESFQGTPADVKTAAVTYSNGTLHTAIPYQAAHAGAGQLTVEVLDPEDGVLGRVERRVTASGAATVGAAAGLAGAGSASATGGAAR